MIHGNYRAVRVTGGWAVYWATETPRGLANAIRVFTTEAQARQWMAAR